MALFFMFNVDRIRLLNNKFRGLSPSASYASIFFDQAPSSQSECHLTVFYISQIVPGFIVYYLDDPQAYKLSCSGRFGVGFFISIQIARL